MKKNISINISGIIFHIEEDGYDDLRKYLDSINRYFGTFDDSHEIIADIEGRIAEIFLSKLKDGKQVISKDDVDGLIATMGSVKDFQALEEETLYIEEEVKKPGEKARPRADKEEHKSESESQPRKLHRDGKRKILGGVLSGIAHYFAVDPLWIRLLYLLLFFGIRALEALGPFLFLFYIAMWIIIPISYDLEEEEKLKKMFRDPDKKVLGGVCSGIAAYFGIDVVVVRLLFFISIFFVGTGVILYIILWIILPEAVSITDKMKMKGQPVTLSNIESNIKKSFNVQEGEENIFVKILLFPFRLIALLFQFLSKSLGPMLTFLVEAVRILVGAILAIAGIALVVGTIILIAVLIGLYNAPDYVKIDDWPLQIISNDVTWYSASALFFALVVPFIFLSILGFITITKKALLNATIGWSLLGIWIISIVVLSFSLPLIFSDFSRKSSFKTDESWDLGQKTLVLKYNPVDSDFYNGVDMNIRISEDSLVRLEREFSARGRSKQSAQDNADMIDYRVQRMDSVFTFDSNFTFKENAKFRDQELDLTLFIPEGQHFVIEAGMLSLLDNYFRRKGYSDYEAGEKTWYFEDDVLRCVDCEREFEEKQEKENIDEEEDRRSSDVNDREFKFDDFEEIEILGDLQVDIQRSREYLVVLNGKKEDLDKVSVQQRGDKLMVRQQGPDFVASDKIRVTIELPEITHLDGGGAVRIRVNDFNVKNVKIVASGTANIDFDSNVDNLEVTTEESSEVNLFGKGEKLRLSSRNASKFNGLDYYVDNVNVDSRGASEVKVYASKELNIYAIDGSRIEYRGGADVEINKQDDATVIRK